MAFSTGRKENGQSGQVREWC